MVRYTGQRDTVREVLKTDTPSVFKVSVIFHFDNNAVVIFLYLLPLVISDISELFLFSKQAESFKHNSLSTKTEIKTNIKIKHC